MKPARALTRPLLATFAAALAIAAAATACGPSTPPPTTPPGEPSTMDAGNPLPPSTPAAPGATQPGSGAELKKPGEATVGDTSTCPVSGEEFTITASSPKAEHAGKTYYFCCSGCDAKFKADPDKYLKPKG